MVIPVQETLTSSWLSTTPVGQSSGRSSWGQRSNDEARGDEPDSSGIVYVAGDTYGGLDNNINAGYNSSRTKQ